MASPERSIQRSQTLRSQRKCAVDMASARYWSGSSSMPASAWALSPMAPTSVPRAAKMPPFSSSTVFRPFSAQESAAGMPAMPAPQTTTSHSTVSTISSSEMGPATKATSPWTGG